MPLTSFQRSLLLIGAALALPFIVLIVFLVRSSLEADRREIEQQSLIRAAQIDALADAQVEADLSAIRALATVQAFKTQSWRDAYARAQDIAEVNRHWRTVILSDLTSEEEIFDLRRPFSDVRSPISTHVKEDAQFNAAVAGRAARDGPGCPCVFVHLPVPNEVGPSRYVLSVGIEPVVFQRIMMARIPEDAVAAIVDRDGRFVARSIDYERRVGTPATEFVRNAARSGNQGFYAGRTYEGLENYTAYHTSERTRWSTHIAVPSGLIDRPRVLSSATLILGTLIALTLAGGLIAYTLYDLEQRRRTEQELAQAQKMEAVGRLTGGVAHDFNNLLTVIIGGLDLLAPRLKEERDKRLLTNAMEAARRGEKLSQQLLAFSRGQRMEIGPVDLDLLLTGMDEILRRTVGPRIDLTVRIEEGARWAKSNANQLELAILNLAINARDAMRDGGELKIETYREAQERIGIAVSDTGIGMSKEVVAKALEPFFTTKPPGEGSGLGLPQVFGIVRQSGGSMSIESQPGKGTRVSISLPRAEPPAVPAKAKPTKRRAMRAVRTDKREIVVVDDDDGVRSFMVEALVGAGFSVAEAGSGEAALELIGNKEFDLLLADYSMTGMTGTELAAQARATRADLPVLIVSGYTDAQAIARAVADIALLRKPFSAGELVDAVNRTLARETAA